MTSAIDYLVASARAEEVRDLERVTSERPRGRRFRRVRPAPSRAAARRARV